MKMKNTTKRIGEFDLRSLSRLWKSRTRRVSQIVIIHLFVVSLAIGCGSRDNIGHEAYLVVPTPGGSTVAYRELEFFLDEEVMEGEMEAWVRGSGCPVWVDICYKGLCETVFSRTVGVGEEFYFTVHSDSSWVMYDFLDDFEPCSKDGAEWMMEPMR